MLGSQKDGCMRVIFLSYECMQGALGDLSGILHTFTPCMLRAKFSIFFFPLKNKCIPLTIFDVFKSFMCCEHGLTKDIFY